MSHRLTHRPNVDVPQPVRLWDMKKLGLSCAKLRLSFARFVEFVFVRDDFYIHKAAFR
jgi:hypothetical protein